MRSKNIADRYVKIMAWAVLVTFTSTVYALVTIPEPYQKAKTVLDAVQVAQAKLKADSKDEYAGLLTEQRVRDAIPVAIKSYEAKLDDAEKRYPGSKAYFENVIKPVCAKIAETGEWKANCWFDMIYRIKDLNGITYDCFLVHISVETPDAQFKAFALPIVDMYFGRSRQINGEVYGE